MCVYVCVHVRACVCMYLCVSCMCVKKALFKRHFDQVNVFLCTCGVKGGGGGGVG